MNYNLTSLADVFEKIPEDAPERFAKIIEDHPRIFVYGAGRSGLMLKAFAMRLAQMGRTVFVVGETVTPAITGEDLLILASASGTTKSVLRCAETAKELGATLYSITATPTAALAALCDAFVTLDAPTKDNAGAKSIMGTVFEQALLLFGDRMAEILCKDPVAMRAKHANLE